MPVDADTKTTTTAIDWWTCAGCGADAELQDGDLTGYEVPCPDCGAAMAEWLRWDTVVAGPQTWGRTAGRSAA